MQCFFVTTQDGAFNTTFVVTEIWFLSMALCLVAL